MGSQISLTISITMIFLFCLAIFGFAINFANDNEAVMNIGTDPTASSTYDANLGNSSQFITESEETYTSILESTIGEGSDSLPSTAPFAPTKGSLLGSIKNIIILPKNAIFGGSGSQFGIFFSVFIGLIVSIFGFYVYKTLRGNP